MATILMTDGQTRALRESTPTLQRKLARMVSRFFGIATCDRQSAIPLAAGYLKEQGHDVTVTESVAEVRRALEHQAPDVLVLDFACLADGLPFAVLDALEELRPGNSTRIVFISMMAPDGEPLRLTEGLVDAYVYWTCHPFQIVLSVEQFLQPARRLPKV